MVFFFFSSGVKGSDGLNRKDQMYNKLIDKFHRDGLDFPKDSVKTEGAYFVQVLCQFKLVSDIKLAVSDQYLTV